MLIRILVVALGLVGGVWTAQAGPEDEGPKALELATPVVEIPMDLSTNHLSVQVFVNGEGPFVFNLDTYAVTTACVDQAFAKRMGFQKVGEVRNGDGSGKTVMRDEVMLRELRFGGATFRNVRALVDDYSWVDAPKGLRQAPAELGGETDPGSQVGSSDEAAAGHIDGLLGYHLFRELLLELDYPGERVILQRGELLEKDAHVISHGALRHQPDFPLRIGEERIVVGVDTGAPSNMSLPSSLISKLKLLEEPVVVGRAKTVYSEADILRGVLAEPLTFAGFEHEALSVSFSEIFGKPLIGHGLLDSYSVTFDQKKGRVRFVKPEQEAEAD